MNGSEEQRTNEDLNEGSEPKANTLLQQVREEREKLDEANKKKEELLNREEELMAIKEVSGESYAGEEKKAEETAAEYKDRVLKGNI
jgi:hypothetical protein